MVLLVIMGIVLVLMETVMLVSIGNCSIGGLLKPITPNRICPKTHYRKPFLMVCNDICDSYVMVLEFSLMFLFLFYLLPHCFYIIFCNYEFIRVKTIAFV